jgi:hypothetical protein
MDLDILGRSSVVESVLIRVKGHDDDDLAGWLFLAQMDLTQRPSNCSTKTALTFNARSLDSPKHLI